MPNDLENARANLASEFGGRHPLTFVAAVERFVAAKVASDAGLHLAALKSEATNAKAVTTDAEVISVEVRPVRPVKAKRTKRTRKGGGKR